MGLLLSLLLGFIPMFFFALLVFWVDRYEKEPQLLLGGVFIWGAIVAAGGAYLINSLLGLGVFLFTGSERATDLTTGALIAPIVEEGLKGFAVFMVFAFFRSEFDSILDGIVYAAIAALGFAATENAFYIFRYGFQEDGMAGILWMSFVRIVLVGWQHPFYTAFIGMGLAVARLNRTWLVKAAAPAVGAVLAIFLHSFHNILANTLSGLVGWIFSTMVDWLGWSVMVFIVIWAVRREGIWIANHLAEEVQLGVITPDQYRTACSPWLQIIARLSAIPTGRYQVTDRFYQTCAELAHKKMQLSTVGDEGGNTIRIERLQNQLITLSRQAIA